jgi:hypothetical protein
MSFTWMGVSLLLICSVIRFFHAEEVLLKQKVKYLGWQTATDKFAACDKTVLEIADGRVEKTTERCRREGGPGVVMMWNGTVDKVSTTEQAFTLIDAKGKRIDFYVPMGGAITWENLKSLKKGDKVSVSGPVPGRAESIVAER